ncbi:MAG: MBL fold metallo-hydrolase [Vicinamibacterales bacterium]
MRVVLLGTGGYFPNERRQTACVLLPEIGVAFDAGTGMFRLPSRLETPDLDVFLSHAHLDHIAGLTVLLPPMLDGRLQRVRVIGAEQTLSAVRTHLFAEAIFPVEPAFDYVPLTPQIAVADGMVTHAALNHPGGSVGYRLSWAGGSLAYVTDTTTLPSLAEFLRGVDLLIHECYFPDDQAEFAELTGHSHTTPVARLARAAGVGRLVLMHVDPLSAKDDPIGLDVARSIFPPTELAYDLMELEV